ncbi:5683_t:CDS:2 [Scutellospora calospora]|uniref:5683_t:CDS:1 n=1 Tax=Scutellospora calospora TaxID=85575 RepID=A0ACA9K4L4_9GLOM|nr:5683_t:CDS:2 [Scutellospora calospora]
MTNILEKQSKEPVSGNFDISEEFTVESMGKNENEQTTSQNVNKLDCEDSSSELIVSQKDHDPDFFITPILNTIQSGSPEVPQSGSYTISENICFHLYQCYLHSKFCDIELRVPYVQDNSIKVHAIIVSRSPHLKKLIETDGPIIVMDVKDSNINQESLYICVGHLYTPHYNCITPSNVRYVLATAYHFELRDLCDFARDFIKNILNPYNVLVIGQWIENSIIYGEYSDEIKNYIFDYLAVNLPKELQVFPEKSIYQIMKDGIGDIDHSFPNSGYNKLVEIYALLPFNWFKRVVESDKFTCPTDLDRFQFARKVVNARAKRYASENRPMQYEAKAVNKADLVIINPLLRTSFFESVFHALHCTGSNSMCTTYDEEIFSFHFSEMARPTNFNNNMNLTSMSA